MLAHLGPFLCSFGPETQGNNSLVYRDLYRGFRNDEADVVGSKTEQVEIC